VDSNNVELKDILDILHEILSCVRHIDESAGSMVKMQHIIDSENSTEKKVNKWLNALERKQLNS